MRFTVRPSPAGGWHVELPLDATDCLRDALHSAAAGDVAPR